MSQGGTVSQGRRQRPGPTGCNNPACRAESRNAGEGGRRARSRIAGLLADLDSLAPWGVYLMANQPESVNLAA